MPRKPAGKKKKVVFVCFEGDWSGGAAREFRKHLREQGLRGQHVVKSASLAKNPERIKGASVIVSPIFQRQMARVFPSEVSLVKAQAPKAKTQAVYLRGNKFDIKKTFSATVKKLK